MVIKINESKKRVNEELRNFTIEYVLNDDAVADIDIKAKSGKEALDKFWSNPAIGEGDVIYVVEVYDESDIHYNTESGEELDTKFVDALATIVEVLAEAHKKQGECTMKKIVKESYSYSVFENLIEKYSGQYHPNTHESIWNEIYRQYKDEDLANDVVSALQDGWRDRFESLKEGRHDESVTFSNFVLDGKGKLHLTSDLLKGYSITKDTSFICPRDEYGLVEIYSDADGQHVLQCTHCQTKYAYEDDDFESFQEI